MIGEPYSYAASFAGFFLLANASRFASSIKFYYIVGTAIGIIAGLYLLSRDREHLKQLAMTIHIAFGSAWLYAPELTPRLKAGYVALAGGAGFAATHIYLHNVDLNTDPRADIVRWALYAIALALVAIGDMLTNAVMIASSFTYFATTFCYVRMRARMLRSVPPISSPSPPPPAPLSESDDDAIVLSDDSDDEDTVHKRAMYLLEGRLRARKQLALLSESIKTPPSHQKPA